MSDLYPRLPATMLASQLIDALLKIGVKYVFMNKKIAIFTTNTKHKTHHSHSLQFVNAISFMLLMKVVLIMDFLI
jgi:hypothetical protein